MARRDSTLVEQQQHHDVEQDREQRLIFFRVVDMNLSRMKTVPVAAGAGRKLQKNTVAVTFQDAQDSTLVNMRVVGQNTEVPPVALIQSFLGAARKEMP